MTGISRRNIHVPFWFFFMQIDMETNKQTENILMLNAILPKECKEWSRNWKSEVFLKTLLLAFMNFMIINIERFAGINFVIAVTKTYFFTSSFILQIVNILVLFFWNLCVLDKMRHYFLNLKGHLKLIKNYNLHCCWYQCYYKWHFYHYSILYIIAELAELHELTLIASFLFLLIVKICTGKLK